MDLFLEHGRITDQTASVGRAVLGIDAAWTATEPSGVALAVEEGGGRWRLAAVAASYEHFLAHARGAAPGEARPKGSQPDARALVGAARVLCGRTPICVAVDMPVGPNLIVRRRPCDDAISRIYGARKAAVHSPSAARPGPISTELTAGFATLGLDVRMTPPASGVIEVYPHAALIEFMKADERLKYKAAKTLTYWRQQPVEVRRKNLREVWARIVEVIEERIPGAAAALPIPALTDIGWRLKAFEDKLDAVVCAAVAIAALNGEAVPIPEGAAEGAIWVPRAAGTR